MKIIIKVFIGLFMVHHINTIVSMQKDDTTLANPVKSDDSLDLERIEVSSSLVNDSKVLQVLRDNENLPGNSTLYLTPEDIKTFGFNYEWNKVKLYFQSFEEMARWIAEGKQLNNSKDLLINVYRPSFLFNNLIISDKLGIDLINKFLIKNLELRIYAKSINFDNRDLEAIDKVVPSLQSTIISYLYPLYVENLKKLLNYKPASIRNSKSSDEKFKVNLASEMVINTRQHYPQQSFYSLTLTQDANTSSITQKLSEHALYSLYSKYDKYGCETKYDDSFLSIWDPVVGSFTKVFKLHRAELRSSEKPGYESKLTRKLVATLPSCSTAKSLASIIASLDQKMIAYSNDNNNIIIVQCLDKEEQKILEISTITNNDGKNNLSFSTDNTLLAIEYDDYILIWNIDKARQEIKISKNPYQALHLPLKEFLLQIINLRKFL